MIHRVQAFFALLAVALAATAFLASPAGAAPPTAKQFAALQKQVTALNKKVTAQTKQIATLKKNEADDFSALAALTVCAIAVTTDAVAGTWNVIDQISTATQAGKTYFGAQPVLSDSGACEAFKIVRSQAVPPTLAAYQTLLALFQAPTRVMLAFAPYAR